MKKILIRSSVTIAAILLLGVIAIKSLEEAASHNDTANQFYSSTFYEYRKFKERDYLKKEELIAGELVVAENGQIILRRADGEPSIGLQISSKLGDLPESLFNRPVTVRVGKALSRRSIGNYFYELRSVAS